MAELKHHKLFIHDYISSREISEIYTSELTENGQLFILLELPKGKIDQQMVVDEILNELSTHFENYTDQNPEKILEEVLRKANQLLPEISSSLKIKRWLESLNLIIGLIDKDNIHVACIGNIETMLVHNNQYSSILDSEENINPNKIFSDITSGQLEEGDVLLISTKSLFDYVSKEKIKNIVRDYTPSAAAIKINELLGSVPDSITFNTLIIKNPSFRDKEVPAERQIIVDYADEYDEEKEEVVVSKPNDYDKEKSKKAKTKIVFDPKGLTNIKSIGIFYKIFSAIGYFFILVYKSISYSFKKIGILFKFIFSNKYRRDKEEETLDKLENKTTAKYDWWKNLHSKKKIALASVFILSMIFLQSVIILTQEREVVKLDNKYEETINTISQQLAEIDTQLIYKSEEETENNLIEIASTIEQAIKDFPKKKIALLELQENVEHKLNEIRRIHEVPTPLELVDLSVVINNGQNIVQKDGVFYILSDNKLFKLSGELLEEFYSFDENQQILSMTDWPGNNRIVLNTEDQSAQKGYLVFDLASKTSVGSLNQVEANTSVADMAIYGSNLYVLDTEQSKIFKYPESGNKFSNASNWLQEEVDLSSASSLTIDGNIYTIDDEGRIKKYLKGSVEPFDYHEPKPPIGPNATIKTFRDSDYLYIIDPQNKKVIIFDKEGNIKDQFTSKKFDQLTDLAIDAEEKAVYLLNNNHLYQLAINE